MVNAKLRVGATARALGWVSLAASFAALADDPRGWLERMERALATRNYQGTFVHEQDGQTETLRIVHRVSGSEIAERIASLDGSGREVIRHNGELTAYFPDQRVVLVESGPKEGLLLTELLRLDTAGSEMYRLSEEHPTRVSGRASHVVAVEPLDDLRYGYRVWIDDASAMPLKTQLRASNGRVVEQLVFTELILPSRIADTALQPAVAARDYRWLRHAASATAPESPLPEGNWETAGLPPGFHLTAKSTQILAGTSMPVTHLVFSDGLACVSVFVEPARRLASSPPGVSAPATMTNVGSSSAMSTVVDGHRVTAIGEVPPATVRAIAGSLREGFASPRRSASGSHH
jgi:sigma-E factor negative regulatory protein RseB